MKRIKIKPPYIALTQQRLCCVPCAIQWILLRRGLKLVEQETIGRELDLIVRPKYKHLFISKVKTIKRKTKKFCYGTHDTDGSKMNKFFRKHKIPLKTKKIFYSEIKNIKYAAKIIADNLKKEFISVIHIGHSGAAQEIGAYLNSMLSIDIYCDSRTSEINKIYKREGQNLRWNSFDMLNDEKLENKNSVVFLPRATKEIPSFLQKEKISRGIVTGQASRFPYSKFEQAFPFSMHANCHELLEYVKAVKPEKVYTLYGFDSEFAAIIRQKLDLFARPMNLAKKKTTLEEFF